MPISYHVRAVFYQLNWKPEAPSGFYRQVQGFDTVTTQQGERDDRLPRLRPRSRLANATAVDERESGSWESASDVLLTPESRSDSY